ncbi:PREDICTED: uncharacterized protein LOC109210043 [Nicotiana attenuata]|nr:PREDICTED: uncharacterized protein LOC109210043 [Nicotiana attenuata]
MVPEYIKVAWRGVMLHPGVHPSFRFILWLAMQRRLATVDRLMQIGINVPNECTFCKQTQETFNHLYFECMITNRIWAKMCKWLGYTRNIGDWECELQWISIIAKSRKGLSGITCCIFTMMVAVIWRERNSSRFEQKRIDEQKVCREMVQHIHVRGKNHSRWKAALEQLDFFLDCKYSISNIA